MKNLAYDNFQKGEILQEISDVPSYLSSSVTKFIVLKGRVKVVFDKPGAKYTPIKVQNNMNQEDFSIDKIDPIYFDEMQELGDFKDLLKKNKFVTHMHYIATEKSRIIK